MNLGHVINQAFGDFLTFLERR